MNKKSLRQYEVLAFFLNVLLCVGKLAHCLEKLFRHRKLKTKIQLSAAAQQVAASTAVFFRLSFSFTFALIIPWIK